MTGSVMPCRAISSRISLFAHNVVSRSPLFGEIRLGRQIVLARTNQPRTYLLNQSIVRCQARSAAALLYRSGVASQLKPCPAPG